MGFNSARKHQKGADPRQHNYIKLGLTAPLKLKAAQGSMSIELPNLPEGMLQQPVWTLELSR